MLNMKITRIDFSKLHQDITVWTSAFPKIGFSFKVVNVIDKDDLILKLKQRLTEESARIQFERDNKNKFDQLKNLEGTEL